MLERLLWGLVLGLLMYVPRPMPPRGDGPGSPPRPPGSPPPGDGPGPIPLPRHRHRPSLPPAPPPTPPPGHHGPWPPACDRPDVPPTPPPGHYGPWPGDDPTPSAISERLREMLAQLRDLLGRSDDHPIARHPSHEAVDLLYRRQLHDERPTPPWQA
jgi:hypothetical protein